MNIKKSKGKLEVRFKDTTTHFVNALRRIMVGEIPVSAIEEVFIKDNNSAIQDEILAHRLGFIPIEGEGTLKLSVKGPKIVNSDSFETTEGDVKATNKNVPVVELLNKQSIDLTAKTSIGLGKDHAKWQSAIVGYEYKNPKEIILRIESCSALTEEDILKKSLEILKNKSDEFKAEISKYKSL